MKGGGCEREGVHARLIFQGEGKEEKKKKTGELEKARNDDGKGACDH